MQQELPFINISADTTVKYLFQTEIGRVWLDKLIKDATNIDLSDYQLVYNELPSGNKFSRDMRTDFMLEHNKDKVIIEVQNSKTNANKGYLYLFRVASKKIDKEESYDEYLKTKTTIINIFNFVPDSEDVKREKPFVLHNRLGDARYNYYKDFIESFEIILPNIKSLDYNSLSNERKEWYLFLSENYEEMEKFAITDESTEVINIIKELAMNSDFLSEYEKEKINEAMINGIKDESRKDGIIEGEKNKQLEIAKTMKLRGMDIKEIAEITQLTQEEIEKL